MSMVYCELIIDSKAQVDDDSSGALLLFEDRMLGCYLSKLIMIRSSLDKPVS